MQKIAPLRAKKKKKKTAISFKQLEQTAISTKLSKDVEEKSRKGKRESWSQTLGKCPQGGDSKTSEGTQGHGILYWVVLDIAKLPVPYVLLTNKKLSNYKTSLWGGEELRWRRSRTGRTLSPPQIHQKNI